MDLKIFVVGVKTGGRNATTALCDEEKKIVHKDKITNIKERPWIMKMMATTAQATTQMMIGMKMLKRFTYLQPQLDLSAERLAIQVTAYKSYFLFITDIGFSFYIDQH